MPPRNTKPPAALPPTSLPTPALASRALRMSYRIARGEQGVLTFEPYKSLLLPHWRFRTVEVARESSAALAACFDHFVRQGDFVGADMARKFIMMGFTRAKRYANHKGGRKYAAATAGEDEGKGADGRRKKKKGELLPKSEAHEGREEKLAASEVFRGVWRRCLEDEGYGELKKAFLAEQKAWDKERRQKEEEEGEEEGKVKSAGRGNGSVEKDVSPT